MKRRYIIVGRFLGLLPWRSDIHFNFAQRINSKYPEACWVNLVNWAIFRDYYDFWDTWYFWEERVFEQECRAKNPGCSYAYCGKCQITKRFYD